MGSKDGTVIDEHLYGPGGSQTGVEVESGQGLIDPGTSSEQECRPLIEEKMSLSPCLKYSKNNSNRKGTDYELALTILFLKRAVERGTPFKLATERRCDEKFDDIFLEVGDAEKTIYHVQAKHREDSSKKISLDDLSSKEDSSFSLLKYFNSYRKLKVIADGLNFKNARFFLSTTIHLDAERFFEKGVRVVRFTGEDCIFGKAGERVGKLYLLEITSAEAREQLFGEARSGIKPLSRKLCDHFLMGKKMNIGQSNILKSYHVALAKDVLIKSPSTRKVKLREEFASGSVKLSEEVATFRKTFYESARRLLDEMRAKQPDRDIYIRVLQTFKDVVGKEYSDEGAIEAFWNAIKSIEIEAVGEFGGLELKKGVVEEIVEALKEQVITGNNEISIGSRTKLGRSLFKLTGYVLTVVREETAFRFNQHFLQSPELPESFKDFRKRLKEGLGDREFQRLQGRQFTFGTLDAKDRDKLFEEEVHWTLAQGEEGEDSSEPDEFLEKLMFVVTPKEDGLRRILKNEMKVEFGDREGGDIYDTLQSLMVDWITSVDEGGKGVYLTKEENPYSKAVEKHALPCWFEVKQPVSTFTGREKDLTTLHQLLLGGDQVGDRIVRKVIVSGMGGLGKSELARKYAEDFKHHYRGNVIWINADSTALFRSFTRLAEALKIIKSSDHKAIDGRLVAMEVYKLFAKKESLFIFDNAQNYREIEPFLPNLGIRSFAPKILITTRNKELFREQEHGNVPRLLLYLFSTETAMQFFGKAVKRWVDIRSKEEEHVPNLVETLGGLPLAMQHAAAYLNQTSCSLLDYNRQLKESKKFMESFLRRNPLDSYDTTIYLTFKVSIDKILNEEEDGKFSVEILRIIAYMAPDRIPSEMFKPLAISELADEKETVRDNMANDLLEISLRLLLQYSLIEDYEDSAYFNVHRMVQYVTRQYIRGEGVAGEHGRAALHQTLEVPKDYGPEESALRKAMELAYDFDKVDDFYLLSTHILSLWGHADGKTNLIKSFIAKRCGYKCTALHLISEYNNPELISSVLRTLRDTKTDLDSGEVLLKDVIEAKDEMNSTPLSYAAFYGSLDNMKVLIANGACINVKAYNGVTVLHDAVKGGSEGCVRYLVEEAKFDSKTAALYGILPVDLAVVNGHVPLVRYLLEKADYDPIERSIYLLQAILNSDSGSKLRDMDEVFEGLTPEVAKRVIESRLKFFESTNALEAAVVNCDEDAVGYLMEKGGLVEAEDFLGVLKGATELGNSRVVRWALESGAISEGLLSTDSFGLIRGTALRGNHKILKIYLDRLLRLEESLRITDMDMVIRELLLSGIFHVLKVLLKWGANSTQKSIPHADKVSKAKHFLKYQFLEDTEDYTTPEAIWLERLVDSHRYSWFDLTPLNVWCVINELERVKVYLEGVDASHPSTVEDIEVSIKLAELYDNEEIVDYLVRKYSSV